MDDDLPVLPPFRPLKGPKRTPSEIAAMEAAQKAMWERVRMEDPGDLQNQAEIQGMEDNVRGYKTVLQGLGYAESGSRPGLIYGAWLKLAFPAAYFYFHGATPNQRRLLSEGVPLERVLEQP